VRQYQYGDDIRAIDWNVTARYNEAHVKVWRRAKLTMMFDGWYFRFWEFWFKKQFKKDIVTEIAATMAFQPQNNDKIGWFYFQTKSNYTFRQRTVARIANYSRIDRISASKL
jgi:hypothetical protein